MVQRTNGYIVIDVLNADPEQFVCRIAGGRLNVASDCVRVGMDVDGDAATTSPWSISAK